MNSTTQTAPKKLYRKVSDKMIAGVCSGIADYFNLDPTLMRLIFVLMLVFGGHGLLIYIVLWIIVPEEGKVTV